MIERLMAEATDTLLPTRTSAPDWLITPLARQRLSPLVWKRFISPKAQPAAQTELSEAEIQNKCFAVLGYLEEYYLPSSSDIAEIKDVDLTAEGVPGNGREIPRKKSGLEELETQLDEVLHLKPDVDKLQGGQRHKQIEHRLSALLASSQVRDRFEKEFNEELPRYHAARRSLRQVRDIDRVTRKLKKAMYKRYLEDKQQHGKLTQSSVDQTSFFQGKLDELEQQKKGIEGTASPATLGYLETQKLLEYKRQLQEKGFVMTPSREHLIDRITREALAGKKIFLVGSTGTGKTQLAFYALNNLTGGYELINWHEGTTPRDLFGYMELWTDELGGVQSGMKPGPVPKALERGVGVIHEEYTGGSTRTQLAAKFMMGARAGDRIQIPGFNGQVFDVTNNFIEVFTGNPKDERTKQREEMDPAILRELTGVEVSYMPASEMNDIIRAKLISESGVLKLSQNEVKYVEQLTKAAEMMQRIHNRDFEGFSTKMRTLLGIDAQRNTDTTLNTNFLDPGTLFKLFGEWELASARGQNFAHYMSDKLREFVTDPKTMSVPEERRTLQKIFRAFGLITDTTADIQVEIPHQDKSYILPSEMAGEVALGNEDPMGDTVDTGAGRQEAVSEIQVAEQRAWQDILGTHVDIAPLPADVTPEVKRKLEDLGMILRFIPKLDLPQSSLRNKSVEEYLQELNVHYPNWKPYESLSDTDKADHTKVRNLMKWYWKEVKADKINFPTLPGQWMAVETLEKPAFGNHYAQTPITTMLGFSDRFKITWNTAQDGIQRITSDVLSTVGLVGRADMRLLRALEWNLLGNREGWGQTNTYEWVEDEYRESGGSRRLLVGRSDLGGAGNADWDRPGTSGGYIGFRVAVVFGS